MNHNITYKTGANLAERPHSAYYSSTVPWPQHRSRARGPLPLKQEPSTAPPARAMARSEDAKKPEAS